MRLESLRLQGFRCFGPDAVTVEFEELTALVGENGTGKTAVLIALARMFGTSNALRTLTKDDFHVPLDAGGEPAELKLVLEARFELPELLDDADANDSVAVPECLRHILADASGGPPVCRVQLRATWTRSASTEGEIESAIEWVDSLEDDPPESSSHPLRGTERSLIQVFYVPATRDATRELRAVSGTILSRVLRHIEWSEDVKENLLNLGNQMADELRSVEAFSSLENGLDTHWGSLRGKGAGTPELSVAETDLTTLLRRIDPRLARSGATMRPLSLLSEGERSLMYFALVASSLQFESEYLASAESSSDRNVPALTILAVEEPENHLAPQYLTRILNTLRGTRDHRAAQVVISSHSASILRRVEPTEIRHFRLDEGRGHVVSALTLPDDADEAFKYVRGAVRAYPELYFARVVVLGEGPSEEVVLPRVAEAFDVDIDPQFVAVVPLGGRHVQHFWRLLRDLGTPYLTLLDLDMERAGGGWGRVHGVLKELRGFGESADIHKPLADGELDSMLKWKLVPMTDKDLSSRLESLEQDWGVYFSSPLDLDLLMLEAFPKEYERLAPKRGGPHKIPAGEPGRGKRLKSLVHAVLGDGGTDGTTAYTEADIERFAWYSYLFVSGSKPAAHARMLAELDNAQLRTRCPAVLSRLIEKARTLAS